MRWKWTWKIGDESGEADALSQLGLAGFWRDWTNLPLQGAIWVFPGTVTHAVSHKAGSVTATKRTPFSLAAAAAAINPHESKIPLSDSASFRFSCAACARASAGCLSAFPSRTALPNRRSGVANTISLQRRRASLS